MSDDVGSSREIILDSLGKLWWVALVRGLLLLVLGGYAFTAPALTAVAYMKVAGVFIVLDGLLAVVAGLIGETESRGLTLGRGAIGILFGGLVYVFAPVVAGLMITILLLLLAIAAITNGFMEIVVAVRHRKEIDGEIWMVLAGVISILFGVVIALRPLVAGLVALQILGVFAILAGVSQVVFAFRLRHTTNQLRG